MTPEAERGFRSLSTISTSSSHAAWAASDVRFAGGEFGGSLRVLSLICTTLATKARETARLRAKVVAPFPGASEANGPASMARANAQEARLCS